MTVGLRYAAVWLPPGFEDAAAIAAQSGLSAQLVRDKLGIVRKCRASADVHPSEMAIKAAAPILARVDPLSVDLLIWSGGEYKDYPVWSAGIHVQEQLGLRRAWAFDLGARCSTSIVALHIARSMMLADPQLRRVLICGGHRTGDLVNYGDPRTRFLFSLSDGSSALLLERDAPNPLGPACIKTDGTYSEEVLLPAGGTRVPLRHGVDPAATYLQVPEAPANRRRLATQTQTHFLEVINGARAGRPIDYLALLHLKPSAHNQLLAELGLEPEQCHYLDHFGHFGAPDQVVSLGLAERTGTLKPGQQVVLAAAGIGYTWSALGMTWEQPCFLSRDALDQHQPELKP